MDIKNHNWERRIFYDDKWFSLDGLDDWKSYMQKTTTNYHTQKQCGGGAVMVWMMTMPNGLSSFEVRKGTINSGEYIKLLSEKVVTIIKLNYAGRKVQNFMKNSGISVLE